MDRNKRIRFNRLLDHYNPIYFGRTAIDHGTGGNWHTHNRE
jgi:hypothetical protein